MSRPVSRDLVEEAVPNPLISLFRRCVVRVDDPQGRFRGTGFFVAPGTVVTCGHVVHGVDAPVVVWRGESISATVTASFPPAAKVADPARYPLPDLAVLTMDAEGYFEGHPCVRLSSVPPALGTDAAVLLAAGYTVEHDNARVAFTGVSTRFESLVAEESFELFKLKGGQVPPGLSGAPLLDLSSGEVVAVMESTRGRQTVLGGFAVPVAALAAVAGEVAAASTAWHLGDGRWAAAVDAERTRAAWRSGRRGRLALNSATVELEWGPDRSPAEALRPRHAVVRYVGREALLADIAAWCEDGGDGVGLWFVTGGGGQGKTRLGVEACLDAERRGWTAGLLAGQVTDEQLEALAEWPGRLLVAVDYAETRPGVVGQLMAKVAARQPRPAVRVLLLVRRRMSRPDLLAEFNDQGEEQLASLLHRAPLSRLDDDRGDVDRHELFDAAIDAFAALTGAPGGDRVTPRLRAAHFARPLYVLVAAFLVAGNRAVDVDSLDEIALLRVLLREHEVHYWQRWAQRRGLNLDPKDQRVAVAVATLLGAGDEPEALVVVDLVPHLGGDPESRRVAVARWLAQLYPPPDADQAELQIGPLEPDRLGEALVAETLAARPQLLGQAAGSASTAQLVRLFTVTGRVARDDPDVRAQLRTVLDERLADLLARALNSSGSDLLVAILTAMRVARPYLGARQSADRFPDRLPAWLLPVVAEITALAVAGLRDHDPGSPAELARMLNNLANRLREAGRRAEALTAAQEAVTLYRALATANPDAFRPALAMSVNNLAAVLSDAGRRAEALTAAQEAVTLYRALAAANPDAFLPDLATSVNNLANHLSDAGRRAEALTAAQEAVTLRRALAAANPDAFLPDLAMSVNNLANHLSDAGRTAAAEALFDEVLNQFHTTPGGRGHLGLARGQWRASNHHISSAVDDLAIATEVFEADRRPFDRAQARMTLRALREHNHAEFDPAWTGTRGALPLWLAHLEDDETVVATIVAWVNTADWEASQSYLEGHNAELLSDNAEATLEHLADANAGNPTIIEHLELLQAARTHGVEPAYQAHGQQLEIRQAVIVAQAWLGTPTWEASKSFVVAHQSELLAPPVVAVLDAIGALDLADPDIRLHRGLMALIATDGADIAYNYLHDPVARRAATNTAMQTPASPRALALTRLDSGIDNDDPDAHFRLATAALLHDQLDEAKAALADCAAQTAPFERQNYQRRLYDLTIGHPDLSATIDQLIPILAAQ